MTSKRQLVRCALCNEFLVPWGDGIGEAIMAEHQQRDCPKPPHEEEKDSDVTGVRCPLDCGWTPAPCDVCNGTGAVRREGTIGAVHCEWCNGIGHIRLPKHLRTHTPDDFIAVIERLREKLKARDEVVEAAREWVRHGCEMVKHGPALRAAVDAYGARNEEAKANG